MVPTGLRVQISAVLFFISLSGCGLFNASTAIPTTTTTSTTSGSADISSEKGTAYKNYAEPALQRRCVSCHASGGEGSAKLRLNSGSALSDTEMAANYSATYSHYGNDGTSACDQKNIVLVALGSAKGHRAVLTSGDTDHLALRSWIEIEQGASCSD